MSTAVQIWVRSCLVFVSLFASSVYAQNVAINATGNAPNASALLDLDGTNKGLLIPRVTYCHRVISACPDGMVDGSGNLAAAAQGLLVYQTDGSGDGEGFYYNTSSTTTPAWVKLFGGTPSGGWELTGNAGTTTGTNFLGTTDAVDLAIYTNNTERMRINGETDANEGFIGVNTTTPRSLFHVRETGTGGVSPILANVETYTLGTSLTGFGFSLHPTNKAKASIFFKSLVSGWGRGDMIFALDQGVDWDIVVEADELMRLTNDGDLGIGTSDPGQMLDVAGDVEIGGGAADYDGTDEFLHINSRNQDWYIGVRNLATANLNDFHIGLTQAQDGIFHIEPGGNVGIGTTTPSSLLSVGGNGDAKYNIFSDGTSTTDGATAIRAEQIAPTGFNTSTAIFGKITTFSSGYQYGVRGDVTNGSASTNGRAYGVQGTAGNEDINFGIYGSVTGSQEAAAVFGWDRTGAESDPIPSMATAGNSWAGFFQGNTYVNSNLGIGDLTPASALTVGSGDLFQVNSSGNIVKINNVTYSWPTVQGAAGQVLENDGAGNLTWVTPSGGGSSGTLIFYEDFEGAGTEIYTANTDPLTGLPEWSYETTAGGRLRLAAGASYYKGGSNAATLDRQPSGTFVTNYLIAEVDLKLYRGSTSLTLDFSYMHHGEENHTNDRVWVRGSNAGLWLQIYDLYANRAANGVWADVTSLDIDATLTAGSQTPSTTFQIRFGQEDNFPSTSIFNSDGFTFDNITIRGN